MSLIEEWNVNISVHPAVMFDICFCQSLYSSTKAAWLHHIYQRCPESFIVHAAGLINIATIQTNKQTKNRYFFSYKVFAMKLGHLTDFKLIQLCKYKAMVQEYTAWEVIIMVTNMILLRFRCDYTNWCHFAYLLPLGVILPAHAKYDQNNGIAQKKKFKWQSRNHIRR